MSACCAGQRNADEAEGALMMMTSEVEGVETSGMEPTHDDATSTLANPRRIRL